MLQNKGYWVEWDGYPGYKEKWQTLGVQFSFVFVVLHDIPHLGIHQDCT